MVKPAASGVHLGRIMDACRSSEAMCIDQGQFLSGWHSSINIMSKDSRYLFAGSACNGAYLLSFSFSSSYFHTKCHFLSWYMLQVKRFMRKWPGHHNWGGGTFLHRELEGGQRFFSPGFGEGAEHFCFSKMWGQRIFFPDQIPDFSSSGEVQNFFRS